MMPLTKPTLIVNKEQCLANISAMAEKARKTETQFRPHFKTHNSAHIGNWFRKMGIHKITVSSVSMAKFFSAYGWRDITVAFPVNLLELGQISELAAELTLNIIGDTSAILPALENGLTYRAGFFIEIDTGHHRTGVFWKDLAEIDRMLEFLSGSNRLQFKGFLTHGGHTYSADSHEEIIDIYKDSVRKMAYLKDFYKEAWPELIISIGDTPGCSLAEDFAGVDEIRPGNFIFYDLMQYSLGSCDLEQIAVVMACPVVSKSIQRNEITIYGGSVHFSKDFLYKSNGEHLYGYVVKLDEKGWSKPLQSSYLASLSQEHGIIRAPKDFVEEVSIGDVLGIIPVHSCLTANLMKGFVTLEGEAISY
ncbi:MAG: alanine racemase [Bacteroidales bacterium]|nr:alanine racemase [Bacteroidales bacterium]